MDELYDDLENYEHDNIVSELKNENQNLKFKLEEYTSTLAKLQKDFDNLSVQYKKLEINYSSLLKTARAEIERKSQLITNLNIEKDKLVIESLQKKKWIRNKINKGSMQQTQSQSAKESVTVNEELDAGVFNSNSTKQQLQNHLAKESAMAEQEFDAAKFYSNSSMQQIRHQSAKATAKEEYGAAIFNSKNKADRIFSQATSSKGGSDVKEKEQLLQKPDQFRDREKHKKERKNKENHVNDYNNPVESKVVGKIRSRRKSMPLLKNGNFQYSSDEEQYEDPRDQRFRRKTPLRDDMIEYDKYFDGKNNCERKFPENVKVWDKYTYNNDSLWSGNRVSNSWSRERDRHKNRDSKYNYELNQRSRQYYSPDRSHYNIHRQYNNKYREANERTYRPDNIRCRTLVSPPSEKYNQYPEKYNRSQELDGRRYQNEGVLSMKHKIQDLVGEPSCKRMKTETLCRPLDMLDHKMSQDRDVGSCVTSISKPLELSYLSLQSPDHVHFEISSAPPHIKEIKNTAETKLDDPRLTSKKYILNTHKDKLLLSTVIGRNVDIKDIDTSKWIKDKEKQKHEMPILLKEKPVIREDLVQNICVSIDNPTSNLSLESGELCLEEETETASKSKNPVNTAIVAVNTESCNNKNGIQNNDLVSVNKTDTLVDNTQPTSSLLCIKQYKIPKVKKSNTPKLLDGDIHHSKHNKLDKREKTKHKKKIVKEKERKSKSSKEKDRKKHLQPDINDGFSNILSDANDVYNTKKQNLVDFNYGKRSPENMVISARDTVEGDLELSDETCDYIDVTEQALCDKENNALKSEECKSVDSDNKNVNTEKPEMTDNIIKDRTIFKDGLETLSEKKHFTIPHKGSEVEIEVERLKLKCKEPFDNIDKGQNPKDIKSKLCDLFGDTSSLITLDDLGIATQTTTKDLNEYNPLFDNTQDAVDLNVEDMEKVQTRLMTLKQGEGDIKDDREVVLAEKRENKGEKTKKTEEQKPDVKQSSSVTHNMFENVNAEPQGNTVVKTVIISTGIQNNCHPLDRVPTPPPAGYEKLATIQRDDKEATCPALLSIQALATSTPHKPQIKPFTLPETSSNNSVTTPNASNDSYNTPAIFKTIQRDLDVPDVRIVVKRRRKVKGTQS